MVKKQSNLYHHSFFYTEKKSFFMLYKKFFISLIDHITFDFKLEFFSYLWHTRPFFNLMRQIMRILHTMLRVGDLDRSLNFYQNALGMRLLRTSENPEYRYTLAYLGYGDEENSAVLELTYNWDENQYDLGTGFGHIAIGVDDIFGFCKKVEQAGGKITRAPGAVKGGRTVIAFAEDPDGYKIEFIENKMAQAGLGN